MKSHRDVVLGKLGLHEKFKRLKITCNLKIIIYNPSQHRYQQISHFLCVSERRHCLTQGLKQKPVGFCCNFTVFSMWNLKISQADGEREGKKSPQTNSQNLAMFLPFFSVQKPQWDNDWHFRVWLWGDTNRAITLSSSSTDQSCRDFQSRVSSSFQPSPV